MNKEQENSYVEKIKLFNLQRRSGSREKQSETGHSPPPMIDTKLLPRQKLGNLSKSHPPPVYSWAWHYMTWSIFSLFGSPAWLYPLQYKMPQSLWGDRHQAKWEREKVLMLCKHCSARAKIPVCYQHCSGHKEHSTTTAAMKKTNSVPARPSTRRKKKMDAFCMGNKCQILKRQSTCSSEKFYPQISDCQIISNWTYTLAGAFDWCSKDLTSFLNSKLNSSLLVLLYHSTYHSIRCRTC